MQPQEPMTVRDLITNPTGPYSRQVAARYTIRDALKAKFLAAMKDPARRKRFQASVTGVAPDFVVWLRVPSEEYDVVYDVVLQLHFPEGVRALSSAEIKLYCNSPSWVFTTGYAAREAGILFPGWEGALGRAAKEKPKVTNPNLDVGFDKVVQQGLLWAMGPGGLLSMGDLQRATVAKSLAPDPRAPGLSAEAKLFEYNRAKDKHDAQKRTEKASAKAAKELDEKRRKADAAGKRNATKAAKTASASKTVKARKSTTARSSTKAR
jgi:hypothetical protein